MTMITWSSTVLCTDADLREFETDVLHWTGDEAVADKWRSKAKDLIAQSLDLRLRTIELETDADDVKDLISNPEVLKDAACYLSLHLIAMDVSHAAGDLYDRKAEVYYQKHKEELERALALVHLDLDESGTIETSEKYAAPTGVRLIHGG